MDHDEGSHTMNTTQLQPKHPFHHIHSDHNEKDSTVRIIEGIQVVYQPLSEQLMSAPPTYADINQTIPIYQPLSIESVHQPAYATAGRTNNKKHQQAFSCIKEPDYEPCN